MLPAIDRDYLLQRRRCDSSAHPVRRPSLRVPLKHLSLSGIHCPLSQRNSPISHFAFLSEEEHVEAIMSMGRCGVSESTQRSYHGRHYSWNTQTYTHTHTHGNRCVLKSSSTHQTKIQHLHTTHVGGSSGYPGFLHQ